jgi:hypothetical protein
MNSKINVSIGPGCRRRPATGGGTTVTVFATPAACSLRSKSVNRQAATMITSPSGCRYAVFRHCVAAASIASCGVFGSVEVTVAAYHRAKSLRCQLAQQTLNGSLGHGFLDQ